MRKTFEISFRGQVQGVGFRPFIYLLAHAHSLTGIVYNDALGVKIKLNATRQEADHFVNAVLNQPPVSAKVKEYQLNEVEHESFKEFQIVKFDNEKQLNLPLTPDFAICKECKEEILDQNNRRYFYPFTTCTNCGPRYAITKAYPFERELTTIADFSMCQECREEYTNPLDRRFHSQTNSCNTCGIKLTLEDNNGNIIEDNARELLKQTAKLLKTGHILAIKKT
ncbi:MAG: acylphosphatase, partial [Fulvivirga sp.]